jgi:L-threonylcarbamoyladenylate synthase
MISSNLTLAARVIQQGGVVAYATEYCFGLGCDPMNRSAVLRLLRIKRRPVQKGLIVLAASTEQLAPYVDDIPASVVSTWPGPHTWLLVPRDGVPGWITGEHPRLAARVTAHMQAMSLCRVAGMAIISTSANRGGGKPIRSDREVARQFKDEVDVILSGQVGDAPAPTPIRDAVSGMLVRPG